MGLQTQSSIARPSSYGTHFSHSLLYNMAASIHKIGNNTELDKLLNAVFTTSLRSGYVEVGEDKIVLPIYYPDYEERIRKFQVRDDDVYLLGQPKSGTTWCHELIWMLANNLDYEGAKELSIMRCPLLESSILFDKTAFPELKDIDLLELIEHGESPRTIRSHLPWNLLPETIRTGTKQPKIVLIFRNPKDACVSNYHQGRSAEGFKGTFQEYAELYLSGRAPNGPFWKHTLSLWNERHRPNIFFLQYEDMKADLPAVIRKMAAFLDKSLTDDQVDKLAKHLSFESMKSNSALDTKPLLEKVNEKHKVTVADTDFIRSGQVGGFTSLMTPDMVQKFDAWIEENTADTDFPVYYNK